MSKIFISAPVQGIIASTRNKYHDKERFYIIYFAVTSAVCVSITMILWQLQKYPAAFICTLAGYAGTHVIMFTVEYKILKKDITEINMISEN